MTDRASALQPLVVVVVVLGAHLSLYPGVADLDGFYHIGHALAYMDGALFDTSLPWATRSVIGDTGGDLWWGFHMLAIPFAALAGVEWGIRLGAAFLTLALALTVMAVLRRHRVSGAGWWSLLFLLSVPNVLFRNLMLRPHVLSLAAGLWLLSLCVRGRAWHLLVASAFIAWLHLSLLWFGPVVVATYVVVRIPVTVAMGRDPDDRGVPLRFALPATVVGAFLGWILRPDAMATAGLLRVQLVELFALKALDLPISFAGELTPLAPLEGARMGGLFLLAWIASLVVLVSSDSTVWRRVDGSGHDDVVGRDDVVGSDDGADPRSQEVATFVGASALLSLAFLLLALTSARRAMEQWVAFGFLTLPFAWRAVRVWWRELPEVRRPLVRLGGLILLTLHLGWFGWRHSLNVSFVSFPAATLSEAAEYLEANSDPGDVVFHARWDNFGPLFARNRTNRYLGGMDPVFLYAHDPASYWEFFFLSVDATTEWTCDAFPCSEGMATDTHRALSEHFGARWVVVEPSRNPQLSLYLLNDPRYGLALDAGTSAVFEVLPAPGDGP